MSEMRNNEELYHYGVVGMKWGVRRGKTGKAYEKASKKLKKLNDYVERQETALNSRVRRADTVNSRRFSSESARQKANQRAADSAAKYRRFVRKADRWYKSMEKTFKDTSISLTSEQVAMGKKYKETLRMDNLMRYRY